jgi:ABC-type transport system involved in multi-copper enzyme maturation permease subunit
MSNFSLLAGRNAVLNRELRVALRNERAFALLAIYVAILGAIVASQFPDNMSISAESLQSPSGQLGTQLFEVFFWAQNALVILMLPGLAAGALAQERERQTLEPLILSPLTPLQIVWGKGVGVLAFTALMLLATVPLSSMSILLGGVSPDMVVAAYVWLLGLAAFITAFGLYCSARWHSATQATVACYGLLPFVLALLVMFLGPGSVIAGVFVIVGAFVLFYRWWMAHAESPLAKRLGALHGVLVWLIMALAFWMLLRLFFLANEFGVTWIILALLFVIPYFLGVTYGTMQRAADELQKLPDPRMPTPERLASLKEEWQRAVAPPPVVYLPAPTGRYSYTSQAADYGVTAQTATVQTATAQPLADNASTRKSRDDGPATYGVKSFLPDGRNPVFAKDLRAGLLGKFTYLFRFSYIITIATELMLFVMLFFAPDTTDAQIASWFGAWGVFHLVLLMVAGATFGARALAPEREQQTLPQLLTTPLRPDEIVRGKMMAVLTYTFYVFVIGLPLALLLPLLGVLPWSSALAFLVSELVLGAFAAALGLFCSLHGVTVRRALGWALGAILTLIITNMMLSQPLRMTLMRSTSENWTLLASIAQAILLPFSVVGQVIVQPAMNVARVSVTDLWLLSLAFYGLVAMILLIKTARDFKRYAQTV